MKRCPKCKNQFDLSMFGKDATTTSGYACWCKVCCYNRSIRHRKLNPEKHLLWRLKGRARKLGVHFNLTIEDIKIPERCPLLGIKINKPNTGRLGDNSLSFDRINPKLGYIKGNVLIVSNRANTLKGNSNSRELLLLAKNLRKFEKASQ